MMVSKRPDTLSVSTRPDAPTPSMTVSTSPTLSMTVSTIPDPLTVSITRVILKLYFLPLQVNCTPLLWVILWNRLMLGIKTVMNFMQNTRYNNCLQFFYSEFRQCNILCSLKKSLKTDSINTFKIAKLSQNIAKNRFGNIFFCKCHSF